MSVQDKLRQKVSRTPFQQTSGALWSSTDTLIMGNGHGPRAEGATQVVNSIPSKCKALRSKPYNIKKC
jgi:hypothetical protein